MSETQRQVAPPAKQDFRPIKEIERLDDLLNNAMFKKAIERAVPTALQPSRVLSTFAGCIRKSPMLRECNILDVAGKVLFVTNVGLELDSPLQQAHLVPFKEKRWNPQTRKEEEHVTAQVIFGYRGLLDLAFRSGLVGAVRTEVVWRDEVESGAFKFEYGTEQHLRHKKMGNEHRYDSLSQAAGNAEYPVWAYSLVDLKGTDRPSFEVMPWTDIKKLRDNSPAYRFAVSSMERAKTEGWKVPAAYLKAPWVERLPAMAAKSVFRHHSNWIPRSVEFASAIALDTAGEERSLDLGPIVDINSDSYAEAAIDAAGETGDPGATFSDRREPETSATKPAAQAPAAGQTQQTAPESQQQRQPAQRKAPAKRASQPSDDGPPDDGRWGPPQGEPVNSAPTGGPAPQAPETPAAGGLASAGAAPQSEPVSFDGWLVDEHGEPIAPFEDAVVFAKELASRFDASGANANLLENNADAMQDARAVSDEAASILDGLSVEPMTAYVSVVELHMDRGKPNVAAYVKDMGAAILDLVPENYLDWIELNRPNLGRVPPSTAGVILSLLVKQGNAIGVPVPPDLAPSLLQRKPPPAGEAPAPAAATATAEDPDWEVARKRASDIAQCRTESDLRQFGQGAIMKPLVDRLEREKKDTILVFLRDAAAARLAQIKAGQA